MKKLISAYCILLCTAINVQAATLCSQDPTNGLSTTDVTFSIPTVVDATDCYGVSQGPSKGIGNQILDSINTGYAGLYGEGDWSSLVKDDDGESKLTATYSGVDFTINNLDNGKTSGYWTLDWTDNNTDILPLTLDVVAVIKAGTQWASYLFDDFVFQDNENGATGQWKVAFQKIDKDGQLTNITQEISGLWLYVRNGTPDEPGDETPVSEPSTLLLGLIGMVGIGLSRRRKIK